MSISTARLHTTLDLSTVEVAARCRHLRDLVFFDRRRNGVPGEISIVAANPRFVLRGNSEKE